VYTLDTNAIIYFLKDDPSAVSFFQSILSYEFPLYVSAVTEAELFSFPSLSHEEVEKIEEILRTVAVIPLDSRIARIAGQLRRMYKTGLADSVISATALFTKTAIVTRNVRDFQKIPHLLLKKI